MRSGSMGPYASPPAAGVSGTSTTATMTACGVGKMVRLRIDSMYDEDCRRVDEARKSQGWSQNIQRERVRHFFFPQKKTNA